jgi:hypothetical protein
MKATKPWQSESIKDNVPKIFSNGEESFGWRMSIKSFMAQNNNSSKQPSSNVVSVSAS